MLLMAIYDKKAEGFQAPFAVPTQGEAMRSFLDGCEDQSTILGKHPEDFELYVVGEFEFATGVITPRKSHVCNGPVRPGTVPGAHLSTDRELDAVGFSRPAGRS